LQAAGGPGPDYVVVEVLGPDHRRVFRVELRVGGRAVALGEGHTIKLAQQEAARSALASPDSLTGEGLAAQVHAGLEQTSPAADSPVTALDEASVAAKQAAEASPDLSAESDSDFEARSVTTDA